MSNVFSLPINFLNYLCLFSTIKILKRQICTSVIINITIIHALRKFFKTMPPKFKFSSINYHYHPDLIHWKRQSLVNIWDKGVFDSQAESITEKPTNQNPVSLRSFYLHSLTQAGLSSKPNYPCSGQTLLSNTVPLAFFSSYKK